MAAARAGTKAARAAKTVRAWEDDPIAIGATPIERPAPQFPKGKLKLAFDGTQPPPALYEPGTPEFRYWTAADTLVRAVGFWAPLLPKGTSWQRGPELTVRLDAGDKLNALYNRQTLSFFHATVAGQTVYTGESPDVVSHECGHAILDAIRPQLWDAMSHEVAAFHESFGDISAILTALQLPTMRGAVVAETNGLFRTSRLSRVAEQLGWGLRQRQPCAADPDCLRNAVNCFFYQPPEQLPIIGPATQLSSEPHNYSRVFTAAVFLSLTGMMLTLSGGQPDADALQQASVDAGRLIVEAVRAAPIVPAYLSQVAAHVYAADQQLFGGKYAPALENGFLSRGLLQTTTAGVVAATAPSIMGAATAGARSRTRGAPTGDLPTVALPGHEFGLGDRPVLVSAPAEGERLAVRAMATDGGPAVAASAEATAHGFLRELVVRDRISLPSKAASDRLHTHEVIEYRGSLRVVRRLIDAGIPWAGDSRGA